VLLCDGVLDVLCDVASAVRCGLRTARFPDPEPVAAPVLGFHGVSFGYPGGRQLYHDLNFGLDMESRFAIVGPNGAWARRAGAPLLRTSGALARAKQCECACCRAAAPAERLRRLVATEEKGGVFGSPRVCLSESPRVCPDRRGPRANERERVWGRLRAGIGKSTLLGLISGTLEPTDGHVSRNPRVRLATFSQHHVDGLDLALTPVAYLARCFPNVKDELLRRAIRRQTDRHAPRSLGPEHPLLVTHCVACCAGGHAAPGDRQTGRGSQDPAWV
jgi:hypothetical protein